MMAASMCGAGADILADASALVPVPLHRGRLWRRRFNQSALLAAHMARLTGVRLELGILERARATVQQVGLTATQREENVRGAFRVPRARRGDLSGERLVLVDDVYTTGATVKAASRALLRAGAARVDVLTFARVAS
jgi:ComF family protein